MIYLVRLLLFLVTGSLLFAPPMGFANLYQLMKESSVIVVAEVIDGVESGESFPLTLRVIRNIHGAQDGQVIVANYHVPRVFPPAGNSVKGLTGLWFLKMDDAKRFQIQPALIGAVPIGLAPLSVLPKLPQKWEYAEETSLLEKLLYELIAELESEKKSDYLTSLGVFNLISSNDVSLSSEIVQRMLASPVSDISQAGIMGLIELNEVSGLNLLHERLPEIGKSRHSTAFEKALCEYQNQDPAGIGVLQSLIHNPQSGSGISYCAAHALRMISSSESLSTLWKEINHQDQLIRYEAILAAITYANSAASNTSLLFQLISFHEFRENESETVSFWKNWMKDNLPN